MMPTPVIPPQPPNAPLPSPAQFPHLNVPATDLLSRAWKVVKTNMGAVIGAQIIIGLCMGVLFGVAFVAVCSSLQGDIVALLTSFQQNLNNPAGITALVTSAGPLFAEVVKRMIIAFVIVGIITAPLYPGFQWLLLRLGRGQEGSIGMIFAGYSRFADLVVGGVIAMLVINGPNWLLMLATPMDANLSAATSPYARSGPMPLLEFACGIWSWFAMLALWPWPFFVLEHNQSGLHSVKLAWTASKGFRLKMLGATLLLGLIAAGCAIGFMMVGVMLAVAVPSGPGQVGVLLIIFAVFLGGLLVISGWNFALTAAAFDAMINFYASFGVPWAMKPGQFQAMPYGSPGMMPPHPSGAVAESTSRMEHSGLAKNPPSSHPDRQNPNQNQNQNPNP